MSKYDFIPTPKEVIFREDEFCFPPGAVYVVGNLQVLTELDAAIEELGTVSKRFQGFQIQKLLSENNLDGHINLKLTDEDKSLGREGYRLTAGSKGINLNANTLYGLFYGIQTLIQIIKQIVNGRIQGIHIVDHPDLDLRAVLIDLRFQTFSMEYIIDTIKFWSHYKVNAVNIEYGNRFPYQGKYKSKQNVNAFTEEEIDLFVKCCREHFIEVIPLVQSFGHMEYQQKNEHSQHIKEGDSPYFSQCCPLNPGSFEASRDLLQQILLAHKYVKRMGIGGGETFHLGECEHCSDYVDKHGKGSLYVDNMHKLIEAIYKMGVKPILYDDMILAYPELISRISKNCILGDLDYWTLEDTPVLMKDWSTKKFIPVEKIAELQEPVRSIFANHLYDEKNNHYYPFAYTKYLMEQGYSVIGHPSTASAGPDDYWTPQYDVHTPNMIEFCRAAKRYGAVGIINTAWERFLFETTGYGVVLGAEYCWGEPEGGLHAFNHRFCKLYFGIEGDELVEAFYQLSRPYTLVEKEFPKVYIKDLRGRIEKSLKEIAADHEVQSNITHSLQQFVKGMGKARYNRNCLAQWELGALVKLFWLEVATLYSQVMEKAEDEEFIENGIQEMDVRLECLKRQIYKVLRPSMPQESIEEHIRDAFKLYDELKVEMRMGDLRVWN